MRRLKGKNVLSRGAGLIMAPIALVGYVALFFLGEIIGLIPLESIIENLENRWYRAALWAGGFVCWLVGALLISAAVIWASAVPTLDDLPSASKILILTAEIGGMVGVFVIAGLAAIGWIAKGNEEAREWARSWGRTHAAPGASSPKEHTPIE